MRGREEVRGDSRSEKPLTRTRDRARDLTLEVNLEESQGGSCKFGAWMEWVLEGSVKLYEGSTRMVIE